jgi:hypothetical protein
MVKEIMACRGRCLKIARETLRGPPPGRSRAVSESLERKAVTNRWVKVES